MAQAFYPLRPGEVACKHYMRTGYCAYGKTCKFDHPRRDSGEYGGRAETDDWRRPAIRRSATFLPAVSNSTPPPSLSRWGTGEALRFPSSSDSHPARQNGESWRRARSSVSSLSPVRSDLCPDGPSPPDARPSRALPRTPKANPIDKFRRLATRSLARGVRVNEKGMREFVQAGWDAFEKSSRETFYIMQDSDCDSRFREICGVFQMSVTAANTREEVSFQRVIVPVMRFVARLDCNLERHMSMPVLANFKELIRLRDVGSMLERMCDNKSIDDTYFCAQDEINEWVPETPADILETVLNYCKLLLGLFNSDDTIPGRMEEMEGSITRFSKTFDAAIRRPASGRNSMKSAVSDFQRRVAMKMNRYRKGEEIARNQEEEHLRQKYFRKYQIDYEFGDADMPPGGRHSNDFEDFRKIQPVPTPDEVMCERIPYLPSNRQRDTRYRIHPPTADLCDRNFRLLRHDLVEPLRRSLLRLYRRGGIAGLEANQESLRAEKGAQYPKVTEEDNQRTNDAEGSEEGSLADEGEETEEAAADDVSLVLYRRISIESFEVDPREGVYYVVEFATPHSFEDLSRVDLKKRWERTKRLQYGTLVCLWWEKEGAPQPCFGIVAKREIDDLVPVSRHRPRLGIRMAASASFNDMLITGACGGPLADGNEMVMIQAGPSFYGYGPFLKALKDAPIPFADVLAAHGGIAECPPINPPAYLESSSGNHTIDLSVLVPGKNVDELKSVDPTTPGSFPVDVLSDMTSLDSAQVRALKTALTREIALIQGPPGTGKTFIGIQIVNVLIANALNTKTGKGIPLGPILCVCYTNHALDQFLVGLWESGISNFVRVGSRSRRQDLEVWNLKEKRKKTMSGDEREVIKEVHIRMNGIEGELLDIRDKIKDLHTKDIRSTEGDFDRWAEEREWGIIRGVIPTHIPHFLSSLQDRTDGFFSEASEFRQWRKWLRDLPFDAPLGTAHQLNSDTETFFHRNSFEVFQDPDGFASESGLQSGETEEDSENCQWEDAESSKCKSDSSSTEVRSIEELRETEDVWSMTRAERWILHEDIKQQALNDLMKSLSTKMKMYEDLSDERKCMYNSIDLRVLKQASVIGITTSGVADKQGLVEKLGSKVVIVEEAAEVHEAHILTSLSSNAQHLIMIGDHQQLRPRVSLHEMQAESRMGFNLNMSLFERLIMMPRFPYATLQTQRRMRTDISQLIKTIYPYLQDHEDVRGYRDVLGMRKNLFFLNHDHPEAGSDTDKHSKHNVFEAKTLVEIAKYLLLQGDLGDGDLAILTPYVGQLNEIKKEMEYQNIEMRLDERDKELLEEMNENEESGSSSSIPSSEQDRDVAEYEARKRRSVRPLKEWIRLVTIDNFQGEEAEVVVISLVRNNKAGRIGFVGVQNRINVLLSRAKRGMYILGNMESLVACTKGNTWNDMNAILVGENAIGKELELVCQNHPDTVTPISQLTHFAMVEDGGCSRKCPYKLKCGHDCPRRCHPDDKEHKHVECIAPCETLLDCGHKCQNRCYQPCGKCNMPVDKVDLPCGHTERNVPCHRARAKGTITCTAEVEIEMPQCGHTQTVHCFRAKAYIDDPSMCSWGVELTRPICGHTITVKCGDSRYFLDNPTLCTAQCNRALECGHICLASCGSCISNTINLTPNMAEVFLSVPREAWESNIAHGPCQQQCNQTLFCMHPCKAKCCEHDRGCPPCTAISTIVCGHKHHNGKDRKCGESYSLCAEPCDWECDHDSSKCPLFCGYPCTRLPCDKRCTKYLKCGCQCPSLCGEDCPPAKFCLKCAPAVVKKKVVFCKEQYKLFGDLEDEDVDNDPLLFLTCGHIFTTSAFDVYMEMDSLYEKRDGRWLRPEVLGPRLMPQKQCPWPRCGKPTGNIRRYGRATKKAAMDLKEMQFITERQVHLENAVEELAKAKYETERVVSGKAFSAVCRRRAERAIELFNELCWKLQSHPRMRLVERVKHCTIESDGANGLDEGSLYAMIPDPDVRTRCRALVGKGASQCTLLAVHYTEMETKLHDARSHSLDKRGKEKMLKRLRVFEDEAHEVFTAGLESITEALEGALQTSSISTAIDAWVATVKLLLQGMQILSFVSRSVDEHGYKSVQEEYKWTERIRADQRRLLDYVVEYSERAAKLAMSEQQNHAVQRILATAGECEQLITDPTEESVHLVLSTVLSADPPLEVALKADHAFRCPNGHLCNSEEGQSLGPWICHECDFAEEEHTDLFVSALRDMNVLKRTTPFLKKGA